MEDGKKVKHLIDEDCELKPYLKSLTVHQARDLFKIRTNMNRLRGNFKNDKKTRV